MAASGSVFHADNAGGVFFLQWSTIVTGKKLLQKHHILIKTFLDIISTADHSRKNEADRRSQRKKLIQKQSFKLTFFIKPKTGTAMANGKNEHLPFVLFFSDFLSASDNS